MFDNQLIKILKTIIEAAEVGAGIPALPSGAGAIPVAQAYQPTAEGVPSTPYVFLEVVGYRRRGQPGRSDRWVPPTMSTPGKEIHTETQVMETTFQLFALVPQSVKSTTQYTAGDIVALMSYILQSSDTVMKLQAHNLGILAISEIRNPKFMDDKQRFAPSPSFDFTITHNLIVSNEVPVLESQELDIIAI